MLSPSIVYIIFNRPNLTRMTFETIRARQPAKLFVIADGPRLGYPTDMDRCREVREIVEQVDWPCEVQRDYADNNLGLKQRVSSGLNWVFEQVDRAIVLEDDCLPHPDFFTFCEAMLDRYENDEHIFVITGNNFQNGLRRGNAAYYFSKYPHCWGWASWRRAWKFYQGDIPFWNDWKNSYKWQTAQPDPIERRYWSNIFDSVACGKIDSWAYPWTACVWYHGGLTITPNVNLVSNIGCGPDATHTKYVTNQEGQPVFALSNLKYIDRVSQDIQADRFVFENHFDGKTQRFPWRWIKSAASIGLKVFKLIKEKRI